MSDFYCSLSAAQPNISLFELLMCEWFLKIFPIILSIKALRKPIMISRNYRGDFLLKMRNCLSIILCVLLALIVLPGGYSLHAIGSIPATAAAAVVSSVTSSLQPSSASSTLLTASGAPISPTSTLGAIKENLLRSRTRFELMLPPNYPNATEVYVSVFPSNLINVNDELEVVHMQFAVTLEWHDSRLNWQHLARKYSGTSQQQHDDVLHTNNNNLTANVTQKTSQHPPPPPPPISKTIIFYPHEIWIPPITIRQRLYSIGTPTASASAEHYLQNSLVDMGYVEGRDDGTMIMIGYFLDAWSCKMRTKLFPFDTQLCHFTLHATTNVKMIHRPFFENVEQMREDYHTFRRVTGSGFQTGEWTYDPEITLALLREPQQFYWTKYGESFVMYRVTITRRPGQHVITWIVPAILLSVGAIIGLYLGCDPSERYSFGAAVIVTLTLMLIGLTDRLPVGEDGFPVLGELYFGLCSTVIIGTLTSTLPEAVRRRYDAKTKATAAARAGSVLRRISAASCTSGIVVVGPSNNGSINSGQYTTNDIMMMVNKQQQQQQSKPQRMVVFSESAQPQQQTSTEIPTFNTEISNNLNGDIIHAQNNNTPTTANSSVALTSTPPEMFDRLTLSVNDVNNNHNSKISTPPQELKFMCNPLASATATTPTQSHPMYRNMQQQDQHRLSAGGGETNLGRSSLRFRSQFATSTAGSPARAQLLRVQTQPNLIDYTAGTPISATGSSSVASQIHAPPLNSGVRRTSRLGTLRRRMSQYHYNGGRNAAAAVKAKFQTSVMLDYILMFTFLTVQLMMIIYAVVCWTSGPTAATFLHSHHQNHLSLESLAAEAESQHQSLLASAATPPSPDDVLPSLLKAETTFDEDAASTTSNSVTDSVLFGLADVIVGNHDGPPIASLHDSRGISHRSDEIRNVPRNDDRNDVSNLLTNYD